MKTRKGCFWFAIWVGGFAAVLLVAVAVFVVIGMIDATKDSEAIQQAIQAIVEKVDASHQTLFLVLNKTDLRHCECDNALLISAKTGEGLDQLRDRLVEAGRKLMGVQDTVMVTNVRHYEALKHASLSLLAVRRGLDESVPTDLVAQDLREALYYLGYLLLLRK